MGRWDGFVANGIAKRPESGRFPATGIQYRSGHDDGARLAVCAGDTGHTHRSRWVPGQFVRREPQSPVRLINLYVRYWKIHLVWGTLAQHSRGAGLDYGLKVVVPIVCLAFYRHKDITRLYTTGIGCNTMHFDATDGWVNGRQCDR